MKKIIMSHVDLGVNISTLVEIFIPPFKYSHPGLNIYTSVEIFNLVGIFKPGENISTVWEYFNRGGNI